VKKVASSRSFGLVFVFVLLFVAGANYWAGGHWYFFWAALAAALLAVSLLIPRVLTPLKRLWLKLGKALNFVVSPVVVMLIYVVAVVPVGILIQLFGKDLLLLRSDHSARSYWINRSGAGPSPESLKDQF
jgi:hypothetical protein